MVPKIPAVKVEQSKKTSVLVLVFLEPLGVQRRYVPHFKGLISGKVELEAQGRDSTFTFCHAHLKKAMKNGLFFPPLYRSKVVIPKASEFSMSK